MKSLALASSFLLTLPFTLFLSIFLLKDIGSASNLINPTGRILGTSTQTTLLADLPQIHVSSSFKGADSRPILVKNYLHKYGSELEPYSKEIVTVSDKYDLDYRLLVAIAQQESNLCKYIPENSYNCWGFGIYGNKVTRFDSYSQAFEVIAKTLKTNYLDKGLDTPEKIMAKYTPPSLELGGPWARGVSQFLSEME